jgi:hypothetical protein
MYFCCHKSAAKPHTIEARASGSIAKAFYVAVDFFVA